MPSGFAGSRFPPEVILLVPPLWVVLPGLDEDDTAQLIVEPGGDNVFSVKRNQLTLYAARTALPAGESRQEGLSHGANPAIGGGALVSTWQGSISRGRSGDVFQGQGDERHGLEGQREAELGESICDA